MYVKQTSLGVHAYDGGAKRLQPQISLQARVTIATPNIQEQFVFHVRIFIDIDQCLALLIMNLGLLGALKCGFS